MRRSASIFAWMSGRRILRMTGAPFASRARWIWAIEAEAYGARSRSRNTSKGERRRACSTCGSNASKGSGAAWLCSLPNSAIQLGGSRSSRMESICPSLTKVGPSCSSAMRKRWCSSRREISPVSPQCRIWPARSRMVPTPMRRTRSPSPWRMKTELISCRRPRSRTMLSGSQAMGGAYVDFLPEA